MKIVGIAGSLRVDSHSHQLLNVAMAKVAKLGIEAEILDLRTLALPFCDGGDAYPDYPDVEGLKTTIAGADGLILVTPEYHGSISGVLKNTLDLLGFAELSGKVVAGLSVLGGQSNSNALNDLRVIIRWVHGWMIPEQVAVGQAWQAFNSAGELVDPKLDQRLEQLVQSLVNTTRQLGKQSAAA
jgi:NAD(P)H-dependent FMN reductase